MSTVINRDIERKKQIERERENVNGKKRRKETRTPYDELHIHMLKNRFHLKSSLMISIRIVNIYSCSGL